MIHRCVNNYTAAIHIYFFTLSAIPNCQRSIASTATNRRKHAVSRTRTPRGIPNCMMRFLQPTAYYIALLRFVNTFLLLFFHSPASTPWDSPGFSRGASARSEKCRAPNGPISVSCTQGSRFRFGATPWTSTLLGRLPGHPHSCRNFTPSQP